MPSIRHRHLYAALALIALALSLLHAGYALPPAVAHDTGVEVVRQHHVWLDDIRRVYGDPAGRSGAFQAVLNRPPSGTVWLENTFQADVTLVINGETLYQGRGSTEIVLPAGGPDLLEIDLNYHLPETIPVRARLGLMQTGLFGERYVQPAWDFVAPSLWQDIARTGFWLCTVLAVGLVITALRLPRRDVLALLALWLLALAIQGVTMAEKLQNSDAHWSMENTWDNYVAIGRKWSEGTMGIVNQEMQVANFVYLGIAQIVLEPDVTTLYGVNSLIGSFLPPLLALAAYGLFARWSTGYVAGIMAALFMPLVHFQQTLQPEGGANLILGLLLGSAVMLYRQPRLIWALLCGLLVGVSTVLRGSWILLILWTGFILWLNGIPWRRKFAYGAVVAAATIAVMSPILYANFSHGVYLFTPTRSEMQLFRANGLDSLGLASYQGISEQLMFIRGERNWTEVLRADIARDPLRLVELTLRRFGLIWQSEEHGDADQVDYEKFSLTISPVTQLLSLNGTLTTRTLLVLAAGGAVIGLRAKRWEALLLLPAILLWMFTLITFFALARFRIGMAIFLLPLAAYGIVQVWDDLQNLAQPGRMRRFMTTIALAAVVNGALLFMADWLVDYLPRPQLVSENEFPASFTPVRGTYGGAIQLLGYAFYESNYRPEGYVVFELFWKALTRPAEDYIVTLRLVNPASDEVESVQNFIMGTNTSPEWKSTRLHPGDILFERYLLRLPASAEPRSYAIFVGIYSPRQETVLPLSETTAEVQGNHLRVTAVSTGYEASDSQKDVGTAAWDGALLLLKNTCTIKADTLNLTLDWQLLERILADWHFFVHVYQGDDFVMQHDGPLDGSTPLDGLPKFTRLTTVHTLTGVTSPDNVRIGFYTPPDGQRLPITFAADTTAVQDDRLRVACETGSD